MIGLDAALLYWLPLLPARPLKTRRTGPPSHSLKSAREQHWCQFEPSDPHREYNNMLTLYHHQCKYKIKFNNRILDCFPYLFVLVFIVSSRKIQVGALFVGYDALVIMLCRLTRRGYY
jgi:hypothetical protein